MRIESLIEGASLAIDQLRENKFRSGLTILGIVVGVATVMAMSAMIQGIRSTITDEMEAVGPRNFVLMRFDPSTIRLTSGGPPSGIFNPGITVREARRIADLPGVRRAMVGLGMGAEFSNGRQRLQVSVSGQEDGWAEYSRATIAAGHDMMPGDVSSGAPVVLLSTFLAEALFGTLDPLNRTVRVNGTPFRVIGIVKMSDNVFTSIQKNTAYMPYTSLMKHLGHSDWDMSVSIEPNSSVSQAEAMDQVITFMRTSRRLHPADDNNFAVVRQEAFLKMFNDITGVFFLVMIALSSVGLLVGGVGVIAIMMIAVTERTREIGIRKAIGATKREILWQFLFEAVTLTCIGAVLGMMLGAGIAFTIAGLTPLPASVPFGALVAALVMAAIAGVAFGMWPAWKAAQMDPVEALRYE